MDSYWDLVLAMPKPERKVFMLKEKVESEQFWLDSMLEDWRVDRSVSLPEIRKQRKRVQQWQRRLNVARATLAKNAQGTKQK